MIIAGEASGDLHGSKLVDAMRERNRHLFFCGIGGKALKDAGVRIIIDASQLAVVGLTEVFSKIPSLFRGMAVSKKLLSSLKPDLLIIIDFPDFNLNVAAAAKKNGIPVLYYISPQLWAWRSGLRMVLTSRCQIWSSWQSLVLDCGISCIFFDFRNCRSKILKSENLRIGAV